MNDISGKKSATLDSLAQSIDDLARVTAKGFENVEKRLGTLERGQEDIILKLDNVAYRFELVALEKRVKELEKRAGIEPSAATA